MVPTCVRFPVAAGELSAALDGGSGGAWANSTAALLAGGGGSGGRKLEPADGWWWCVSILSKFVLVIDGRVLCGVFALY
jgi:hypothetical protein